MADLFPPPQDRNAGQRDMSSDPRPDPTPKDFEAKMGGRGRLLFPFAQAEAAIELLSRWTGPVALIAALALIGWWFFG